LNEKKRLSMKDRWYYFLEYYWIPALLAVILLGIGAHFLFVKLTAKEVLLTAVFCDAHMDQTGEQLQEDYLQYTGADPRRQEAVILTDLMLSQEGAADYTAGSLARLYTEIGDETLDVCMMSETDFVKYAEAGIFSDLSETAELLRISEKDLVRDEAGSVVGIRGSALVRMREWNAYSGEEGGVAGVLKTAPNAGEAVCFIGYLAGQQPLPEGEKS